MVRTFLVAALAGALAAVVVLLIQGQAFHLTPVGMTYADLAATLLAAAGVLLTVIGIFIAALAIWGFTAFRAMTKNSAKAHVSSQLRQGELRNHVETVVKEFLAQQIAAGELKSQIEETLETIVLKSAGQRAQDEAAGKNDTTENDAPLADV